MNKAEIVEIFKDPEVLKIISIGFILGTLLYAVICISMDVKRILVIQQQFYESNECSVGVVDEGKWI